MSLLTTLFLRDAVKKFNPNHDEHGRFSDSEGGGSSTEHYRVSGKVGTSNVRRSLEAYGFKPSGFNDYGRGTHAIQEHMFTHASGHRASLFMAGGPSNRVGHLSLTAPSTIHATFERESQEGRYKR